MLHSVKPLARLLRASPAGRAHASHIEQASGVPGPFVIQRLGFCSWIAPGAIRQARHPLRVTLANERRFFADVDERELRRLEETHAAEQKAADTAKAQNQPQSHQRAEPYRALKRSQTGCVSVMSVP